MRRRADALQHPHFFGTCRRQVFLAGKNPHPAGRTPPPSAAYRRMSDPVQHAYFENAESTGVTHHPVVRIFDRDQATLPFHQPPYKSGHHRRRDQYADKDLDPEGSVVKCRNLLIAGPLDRPVGFAKPFPVLRQGKNLLAGNVVSEPCRNRQQDRDSKQQGRRRPEPRFET